MGNGEFSVDLDGVNEPVTLDFYVTVAKIPQSLELDFADSNLISGGNANFVIENENITREYELNCKAVKCAPGPIFDWWIDDVPYNVTQDEFENTTETNVDDENYLNYIHTIKFKPKLWMDGKTVYCRTEHIAYDQTISEENRAKHFMITIQGPPVPSNDEVETITFDQPHSGSEGVLLVPFHSNPVPKNISWEISGEGRIGKNGTSGRFTSEGWEEYNGTTPDYIRRIRASTTAKQFVAKLRISKLKVSDGGKTHSLFVENEYGTTKYNVRVQHIKKVGLTDGEIAGVVIGVIAGVLLIAAAVILVIRHRNLKKAKKERQERRRQRDGN